MIVSATPTKRDENPDLPDIEDSSKDDETRDTDADELDDDLDDTREGDEGDSEDDDEDADDQPLREEGKKALDRMKATVKDLKKTIRDLKAENAELRNGDDGEDDELTVAQRERDTERTKRVEAEKKLAAKLHGLPESWADRLKGDDLDDFLDDAEALAEDMPNPRSRKGGGGAKDGGKKRKEPSLDDQIVEAEKAQDFATARRLKAQKIHALRQG